MCSPRCPRMAYNAYDIWKHSIIRNCVSFHRPKHFHVFRWVWVTRATKVNTINNNVSVSCVGQFNWWFKSNLAIRLNRMVNNVHRPTQFARLPGTERNFIHSHSLDGINWFECDKRDNNNNSNRCRWVIWSSWARNAIVPVCGFIVFTKHNLGRLHSIPSYLFYVRRTRPVPVGRHLISLMGRWFIDTYVVRRFVCFSSVGFFTMRFYVAEW